MTECVFWHHQRDHHFVILTIGATPEPILGLDIRKWNRSYCDHLPASLSDFCYFLFTDIVIDIGIYITIHATEDTHTYIYIYIYIYLYIYIYISTYIYMYVYMCNTNNSLLIYIIIHCYFIIDAKTLPWRTSQVTTQLVPVCVTTNP